MSWGLRITILYLGFVAMIVTLVVVSANQSIELESKDYYAQELKYQQKIDALNNTNNLTSSVSHVVNANDVLISFPKEQVANGIKGDILFFCQYDSKKDKRIEIAVNANGEQLIPFSLLSSGKYTMKISWNVLGKDFYKESPITIK
jgi:hypothetical protein